MINVTERDTAYLVNPVRNPRSRYAKDKAIDVSASVPPMKVRSTIHCSLRQLQ